MTNISEIDHRRIIFVSMIGAFKTWKKVPLLCLYSCIFILPIKRDWLYDPNKYRSEIDSTFIAKINLFRDCIEDVPEFIELLKWKDSQGLVFYTKDHGQSDSTHVHSSDDIHPFWDQFSDKLSSLYDPITKNTYEPLRVDETWWRSFKSDDLRFHTSCSSVLKEISSLNGVYKSMQEILYQSNPDSLNPIISYTGYTGNHSSVNGVRSSRTKPIISSTEAGSNTDTKPVTQYQDESGFVIFSDYFSA